MGKHYLWPTWYRRKTFKSMNGSFEGFSAKIDLNLEVSLLYKIANNLSNIGWLFFSLSYCFSKCPGVLLKY